MQFYKYHITTVRIKNKLLEKVQIQIFELRHQNNLRNGLNQAD
jgi:hypothetical protein